jgi:hypothetical protein
VLGPTPCITCFSRTTRITNFNRETPHYQGKSAFEPQDARHGDQPIR